ncbi:lipopolysaccharide cholinephosphotransferase [Paenibacillus taihuensis]|uniref:Lipopolysaccharide cholinephosphotransferase n=1 Tax=Paenibacillus taihuensis TaxID=1156355 RepID=A0A3D9S2V0_9BACL|nr:LicD family protein [Paenibacillus taihuensis]REE84491.1 lipopolysaccharide cholinephosphotransferase [Paenibacillus taihuensis]
MQPEYTTMPPEDLRQLQLIQLEMLLEVDRICKKRNIKYCIIAGTTLGAVRHKGYIPWDDDADVAMFRSEYERFCKVCEEELDESRFYLQTYKNTPGYRWGYGKIRRKGTEFLRKGQEHMPYPTGIFIDIFPLDNVPDNKYVRRIHNFACTVIRKMLWSAVGAKSDRQAFMRGIFSILSLIPRDVVFWLHDILMRFYNRKPTQMVRKLMFPTPNNGYYGYYRRWYEELAEIEFEGHLFPAAKNYDEYLSFKFGNYMELPPIEQRQGHPATRYKLLPEAERK